MNMLVLYCNIDLYKSIPFYHFWFGGKLFVLKKTGEKGILSERFGWILIKYHSI